MNKQSEIKDALASISSVLNSNVKWIVGGSGSLLVHGIDVVPNDIDLVVDNGDYNRACELLGQYLTSKPKPHGKTTKTAYKIGLVEGDLLMYPIDANDIELRDVDGHQVPVNKLELEYSYYKARTDKVEANASKIVLIEEELKRRSSQETA